MDTTVERATLGVVPLEGRASLPFVDLHGEPLFLHAVRALLDVAALGRRVVVTADRGQAERAVFELDRHDLKVPVEDTSTFWTGTSAHVVVLHDPLCPLVPAAFVARLLAHFDARSDAIVSFRPVTDTIKTVVDDRIVDTIDRDHFGIVTSPVIFTSDLVEPGTSPPTEDFAALATWLRDRGPVGLHKAPSLGRRVDDSSAVNLLECMDEMSHAVRET